MQRLLEEALARAEHGDEEVVRAITQALEWHAARRAAEGGGSTAHVGRIRWHNWSLMHHAWAIQIKINSILLRLQLVIEVYQWMGLPYPFVS